VGILIYLRDKEQLSSLCDAPSKGCEEETVGMNLMWVMVVLESVRVLYTGLRRPIGFVGPKFY
jgi:hypothetical protein